MPLLVILGIHHTMGLGMAIPMNLVFANEPYYHEMVFLLQFAAAIALGLQNYGYILDVKTASGLFRMKMAVTITLCTIIYSRVLRFAYVGYKLLGISYASGGGAMFYGGCAVICLMGLINTLFTLDATGKFSKFIRMKHIEAKIDEALTDVIAAVTPVRIPKNSANWAKLRGVKAMGAFKAAAAKDKSL